MDNLLITVKPRLCIRNLLHPKMISKTPACSKNNAHHSPAMFVLIFLARATVFIAIFAFATISNA